MPEAEVRYPDCVVELSGSDGNIYSVIAHARVALRRYLTKSGIMPAPEAAARVRELTDEITSQTDYDQALAVVFRWMTVE